MQVSGLSMARGHPISTEADPASTQVGEIRHARIIPPSSSHPLMNPTWQAARNHHGKINRWGSYCRCPPLHKDSNKMKCYPHTQYFSQNKRQVVHQTIFSIAFLLTNIFGTVMVYQHKSLSVPGDLHNLKGLHGHFNITQHLTIQKASCSRTLDPWKWSQAETLCAHPASQFFSRCPSLLTLGHEFSRQPHHHSLLSSDMAFPMNPTFLGQVFPLLKVTSRNIWALLCHRHTHFHKQATVSFHFTFCEPLHQWKHHRKTYRCTIYTGSSRLCSWPVMFCNASATSDGNGENWGAIPFLKVLLGQLWITMALISCSKSETEILISGRI